MSTRIQFRRGTAAAWTSANPVLAAGEPGFETDTGLEKLGDGSTAWVSLAYVTDASRLGPLVVNRSALADGSTASVAAYRTLYPEDFVTGGYVWNSGDDTPAMQACVDAAYAAGGNVEVQCPPSIKLNSAPRTDRSGNAVLALPGPHDGAVMTLSFRAAEGGTTWTTTVTGRTYSASFGPPSLIGGPTAEQTGIGPHVQFSGAQIEFRGHHEINLGGNPTLCGVDLASAPRMRNEHIEIRGGSSVQPTNIWQFGIRLPEGDNAAEVDAGYIFSAYSYAGIVANSAHPARGNLRIFKCQGGLCLTGNTQFAGNDGHSAQVSYLDTEWCVHHIASWDPTAGIISLPASKPAQIVWGLWDIEDAVAAQWYTTVDHVLDANNQLRGGGPLGRVIQNTGPVTGYTLTGAAGLRIWDIGAGPSPKTGQFGDGSDGACVFDGVATVPGASLAGSTYTLTRPVNAAGVTTISNSVTVKTHGYPLLSTIAIVNNGTIDDSGNPGLANGTAGAATGAGLYAASQAGANAGTGAGTGTANLSTGFGIGTGGAGGTGTGGAGGAGGTTTNGTTNWPYRMIPSVLVGAITFGGTARAYSGAAAGGPGGGDTTNKGGGPGSGGGAVILAAPSIINNGTISAKGGDGGTPTLGNCGGGGPGGGGAIRLYTLIPMATLGTTSVVAGAIGTGVGTGTNASVAAAGTAANLVVV